jgi:hypothetical protein
VCVFMPNLQPRDLTFLVRGLGIWVSVLVIRVQHVEPTKKPHAHTHYTYNVYMYVVRM